MAVMMKNGTVEKNDDTMLDTGRAAAENVDTLEQKGDLAPWVRELYDNVIIPRRRRAALHPFTEAVRAGEVERSVLAAYFSGMYWHVTRAGHLFGGFFARRSPDVETFLAGRAEDGHSPEEETRLQKTSLGALITEMGGDIAALEAGLLSYAPPQEWFLHETQLRSAIFSADFPWQVGAAAINAGTEGIVPWMCGPLAGALVQGYHVSPLAVEWLNQRITPEEIQHGDNGFLILSHFVDAGDAELVANCARYADRLSVSMSQSLLDCGLRLHREAQTA